ncbi:MAG: hypothetical protein M5U34_04890 [Chloroflexi bacterium]|nr:hypothetical protein [Chloroflexota bacterium]
MTGRSSEEAWVDYSTSNGNGSSAATADLPDPDFNPTIGRLTWAAGTEGKQEIIVQINDDDIDEASPEFFVISLFDNAPSIVLQRSGGHDLHHRQRRRTGTESRQRHAFARA